jgi:hypothetical protein
VNEIEPRNAVQQTLIGRIESVAADVEIIERQLAGYKGGQQSAVTPKRGPRNPRTERALRAKLSRLELRRAWSHAQLIALRGELPDAGYSRLIDAGIVSPPQKPVDPGTRRRGRPSTTGKSDLLVTLTNCIQQWFLHQGARIPDKREAINLATALRREFTKRYNPELQAKVDKYVSQNGLPAHYEERRYYEARARRKGQEA